jgi:hypothetical protein
MAPRTRREPPDPCFFQLFEYLEWQEFIQHSFGVLALPNTAIHELA